MNSSIAVNPIPGVLPELGSLSLDNNIAPAVPLGRGSEDVSRWPLSLSGRMPEQAGIPSLPMPHAFESFDLVTALGALKIKITDGMIASSMDDIRSWGEQQRQLHEKVGEKIVEAARSMAKAKKRSRLMKFLGWLAVGLSVAVAAVTGGTLAVVAAAVTVGIAVLNETGVVQKATKAIAQSLLGGGMDERTANMLAMGIAAGIIFLVSALTLGAGFMNGATNGFGAAAMWSRLGQAGASTLRGLTSLASEPGSLGIVMARVANAVASDVPATASSAAKIAQIGQAISTSAQVGGAIASISEALLGIESGVLQKKATDAQADAVEIRNRTNTLMQFQSSELDFIRRLIGDREAVIQSIATAVESQSQSSATLVRHFA